jgi:Ni/Co efflux regulator RcnB
MRRRFVLALAAAALAMSTGAQAQIVLRFGGQPHRPHHDPYERPRGHWERGDRGWWRGRAEWRGYHGERPGFWYAPGYGYYPVERELWRHRWRRGQYLPEAYRHYYVDDWEWFGVRPPPRGYAWVWCGDQIALVSQGSGLILDVVDNVY